MERTRSTKGWMLSLLLALLAPSGMLQAAVPEDASSVVNLSLEEGQAKLQKNGYEIAGSSLFSAKQLWWNEAEKACVEVEFDKKGSKLITAVTPGDEKKCVKGAAASRKVWESYRDGQAPASSATLEVERAKLSEAGYAPTYWIDDMSPGRDAETWYNANSKQCTRILFNAGDSQVIKTMECKPEQGMNPAPKAH